MATGKHFNDLPEEMLVEIFSYISMEDLAMSVQHVSARWKDVSQNNALWENKVFSPYGETTNEDPTDEEIARCLKNMPALKAFCPKQETSRNIVNVLCQYCKNIDRLEFSLVQRIKNKTLKRIVEAIPGIVNLSIPVPNERRNQLEFAQLIGKFQYLTTLSFTTTHLYDFAEGTLMAIADGCPSLQHLDFGYCIFPDLEMRSLLKKRGHQLLSITICSGISASAFELLCDCTNLKFLHYENLDEHLSRTSMNHLSRLSKLEELRLGYFPSYLTKNIYEIFYKPSLSKLVKLQIFNCREFAVTALAGIFNHCLQLKDFRIGRYGDSDEGFKYISNLKHLEHLGITSSSSISDKSLEYIGSGCKNLRHLNIGHCLSLTDRSIEFVSAGCPKLKYLCIKQCPLMTDAVIESVIKCKELTVLDLSQIYRISGSNFHMIPSNLTHLKELYIYCCVNLDFKSVTKLKEEIPRLKIMYDMYIMNDE